MIEKLVRKITTIINTTELGKNVAVNLFFRGAELSTFAWQSLTGFLSNKPYDVGYGMGGYIDKLLF